MNSTLISEINNSTKTTNKTTNKKTSNKTNTRCSNFKEIEHLFSSLQPAKDAKVSVSTLQTLLSKNGITIKDPRYIQTFDLINKINNPSSLTIEQFEKVIQPSFSLFSKVLKGQMVIPNFSKFSQIIKSIYDDTLANKKGVVADYIPQLKRVDPEQFAVTICTIDGQILSLGDCKEKFCVQSTCKPISYSLALEEHGEEYVHNYIGREPSGRGFNELTLNKDGLPHNPMINAGAIMSSALIKPNLNPADRFDYLMKKWIALSGNSTLGFNNAIYLSERETADRNFALAYFMREKKAFPKNCNLLEILEFYFQTCSIEVSTNSMAIIAATLANAGIVPTTGEKVFQQNTVKNCLSLMYSSGMYDFSGEFAFSVGLPAKSGVSGGMWFVVPNVMGVSIWSPRLDSLGNSVRGVDFCNRFISKFNFHNYDSLITTSEKIDPRLNKNEKICENTVALCYAASFNDMNEIRHLVAQGINLNICDYDGRTPLHLAASEGHLEVVTYLVNKGVDITPKDRWGNTALADAILNKQDHIALYLKGLK